MAYDLTGGVLKQGAKQPEHTVLQSFMEFISDLP